VNGLELRASAAFFVDIGGSSMPLTLFIAGPHACNVPPQALVGRQMNPTAGAIEAGRLEEPVVSAAPP
jgi:hypothetical protein